MRRSTLFSLCFVGFFMMAPLSAVADPIEFYLGGSVNLGGVTSLNLNQSFTVSDPSQGLKVTWDLPLNPHNAWGDFSAPIKGSGFVWINSGAPLGSPALDLSLSLDGKVYHDTSWTSSALSGSFTGTAAVIGADSAWNATSGISPWLLDLAQHPERIHLSGFVSGGVNGVLETTLSIDPPTVPEPATVSLYLALTTGLVIRHRRRLRRSSTDSTISV
ncbi:hypothetical protein ACYOEI_12470 [Singulisphaera rosea]